MTWGQGASGNLLLGNGMKPLTTIQAHLNEPIQAGGFLKFLGQVDFHGFYGRLDGDRAADAAAWGRKDYDHAGSWGCGWMWTPASWFTLGISRISLLGGHGNGWIPMTGASGPMAIMRIPGTSGRYRGL